MDQKPKCPLCESDYCSVEETSFGYFIRCNTYEVNFHLSYDIYTDYSGKTEFRKLMNLIVEKTLRSKTAPNNADWSFYCDPNEEGIDPNPSFCNLASLLSNYPSTFMDIADRVLLNLANAVPDYGRAVSLLDIKHRWFFPIHPVPSAEVIGKESIEMIRVLADLGYLKNEPKKYFVISADGWKRAETLKKESIEVNQGFIAMSFKPEAYSIRERIKDAIKAAGFSPMVIDEKEHNHQIVPEMLLEIERSKFLVLDVTIPSYGAYYEAGYALALGKEVIVCCADKVFSDPNYEMPHFDVAQTFQIRWGTEEELVEKLKKRIKATVAK